VLAQNFNELVKPKKTPSTIVPQMVSKTDNTEKKHPTPTMELNIQYKMLSVINSRKKKVSINTYIGAEMIAKTEVMMQHKPAHQAPK
jgi:hypothetical protein